VQRFSSEIETKHLNCRTWSGFSSEIENCMTMVMARSGSSLSSERTRAMLT